MHFWYNSSFWIFIVKISFCRFCDFGKIVFLEMIMNLKNLMRFFWIILTHHSLTSQKRLKIQSCSSFQFWCSALLCHFVGWNRILKRMQFLCILSIFAYYHAPSSLPKLYYTTDTGFSFLSSVNSQLPLKRHKKNPSGRKKFRKLYVKIFCDVIS